MYNVQHRAIPLQELGRQAAGSRGAARIEARPEGVEPPTYGFEVRRSIQLSYGRVKNILSQEFGDEDEFLKREAEFTAVKICNFSHMVRYRILSRTESETCETWSLLDRGPQA